MGLSRALRAAGAPPVPSAPAVDEEPSAPAAAAGLRGAFGFGGRPPPPPPPPGVTLEHVKQELAAAVAERGWGGLYPPARLNDVAARLARVDWAALARAHHRKSPLDALCLARLALVDIAIFVDDSGSMTAGSRVEDAAAIVGRVASIATLFDDDGILVRFINSVLPPGVGDSVRSEADAMAVFRAATFNGGTNVGTELRNKLLAPFVMAPLASRELTKPVLIYVVTDGAPMPEPRGTLRAVIVEARAVAARAGLPFAFGVSFAQVGQDEAAARFLSELDDDPQVGDAIDAVSDFDAESAQVRAKTGMELSVMDYVLKLMLGAIDRRFDALD
jgi:hypothetical protein